MPCDSPFNQGFRHQREFLPCYSCNAVEADRPDNRVSGDGNGVRGNPGLSGFLLWGDIA